MHKYIIYFLVLCLTLIPFCQTAFAKNIQWQDEVNIDNELIIVKNDSIRIEPGTNIYLTNIKSKLNINGSLIAQGNDRNPVAIIIPNLLHQTSSASLKGSTIIETNNNLKELEIYPYNVDTEEGIEELKAFRRQYAFVWLFLMGVQIYLVLNRTAYW